MTDYDDWMTQNDDSLTEEDKEILKDVDEMASCDIAVLKFFAFIILLGFFVKYVLGF